MNLYLVINLHEYSVQHDDVTIDLEKAEVMEAIFAISGDEAYSKRTTEGVMFVCMGPPFSPQTLPVHPFNFGGMRGFNFGMQDIMSPPEEGGSNQ